MWNQSFTLYLYVNSWDLNCHSYVVFLPPQPGAFHWTSPPSQSAGITIAGGMATAKYISGIPVSPQFWHFYRWSYSSGSPWISYPAWNAGSTTTESSAPKYNAGWSKSPRFCSHLPAGNPEISSPTWHMECKEPFIMDGNRKLRCQMIHISLVLTCDQAVFFFFFWRADDRERAWSQATLVLAYQPIPTRQLIRKCLPSWNAEIPAVWISFAKCKSKLSASSI